MPFGNNRTSDFFASNIRTFHAKHPYFTSKKSVLSAFPNENQLKHRSFMGVDLSSRPPHAGWESRFRTSKWTVFLQFRWQHCMSCTFFCAKSYAGFYTHIYILFKGDIQQKEGEEGSPHAVLPPLPVTPGPTPKRKKWKRKSSTDPPFLSKKSVKFRISYQKKGITLAR